MRNSWNRKSQNFWKLLPKPFFALAPMANVTDSVFRKIIAKYGKPDVMWTEFVSADGLVSAGKKKLMIDLKFSNKERPIVAQLFSGHPDAMRKAASVIAGLGFDGLDINMGCPDRAVEKQGGGARLIKDPKLAIEVLRAAREGLRASMSPSSARRSVFVSLPPRNARESRKSTLVAASTVDRDALQGSSVFISKIPVSVKTRIGYSSIDLEWIRLLLEQKIPALTVHLRTRKEMSDVPAHWDVMPDIIRMRDEISPDTLIIGNGDVASVDDGVSKCKKYGCDGVMIGRGIFGKPWLFDRTQNSKLKIQNLEQGIRERQLRIMLEHAKLFEKTFKGVKRFAVMRKHFKAYVSGWDGAKELRMKLMKTEDYSDVEKTVKEYLAR